MTLGKYTSPLGDMLLAADNEYLIGLWFEGQKYFPTNLKTDARTDGHPILELTYRWLDIYFSGRQPDFMPPLAPAKTESAARVRQAMLAIPFGRTANYSELALQAGKASAVRATAGIVARNPFILIVPCHRIIGINGTLTGYAAGLERKKYLLEMEARQSS